MRASLLFAMIICSILFLYCGSLAHELSRVEASAAASNDPTKTSGNSGTVVAPTPATAIWARTVSVAPTDSSFNGVAVDTGGNIYAAGSQFGNGTYTYGSQSISGPYTGSNIALVKYQ